MTTTACPNCGQPLRPGVRFCGNCGYGISAKPIPAANAAPSASEESVCPHCGRPVRPGARFCNNCGKGLEQPVDQSAPPVTQGEPTIQTPAHGEAISAASPTTQVARKPGEARDEQRRPTTAPGAEKPVRGSRRRNASLWVLIAVLVGVCGLTAVAVYVYMSDPFGWFGKAVSEATPSPQAIAVITETAPPIAPSTLAPTPTSEGEAVPTLTDTPIPSPLPLTDTPQPTVSATLSETLTLTPTNMLTQPVSLPTAGALIILEDDFSGDLNTLWAIWGKPRPKIDSGPGDSWLDLAAPDDPRAAGVTTKALVPNEPGVEIAFTAQLNPLYSQHMMVIDWDKIPFERVPESKEPGDIHLEIRNNKLILRTPLTRDLCQLDWLGVASHTYRLKIVEGPGVELYVDEETLPLCKMASIGQTPTRGRVSISGVGWVTYIIITGP